jgi:hypothetical protein
MSAAMSRSLFWEAYFAPACSLAAMSVIRAVFDAVRECDARPVPAVDPASGCGDRNGVRWDADVLYRLLSQYRHPTLYLGQLYL